MAQNPIEGGGTGSGGSGTGLTLSNQNFGSLNSVNCNRPEVFGQIADIYLKCFARRSGRQRSGAHSKTFLPTSFSTAAANYTVDAYDLGNQLYDVAGTPTWLPSFRLTIRNSVSRAVLVEAFFPYSSFDFEGGTSGVNWALVSGALITP